MNSDEIRQIKDHVPIMDAAMRLGLELDTRAKKARCFNSGGGSHKSGDRTPSLSFFRHEGTEFFKCWGCGIRGDLFKLVQEVQRSSFIEAARWLNEIYHLRIPSLDNHQGRGAGGNGAEPVGPSNGKGAAAEETGPVHPEIQALPEESPSRPDQDVYRELLRLCPANNHLAEQLRRRGIDPAVIDRYPLGWIENGWKVHEALVERFGLERLRACGLSHPGTSGKETSFLYGMKFLFPFIHQQEIVFLQARSDVGPGEKAPKGKLKFKNPKNLSAAYPYNADAAYRFSSVYICESVLDMLTLASIGSDNLIALKGTQTFLPEYAHWLKEAGVTEPVLAFNADEPGYAAVDMVAKIFFLNGFERVLSMLVPHGLDLNDFYGRGVRPDWMKPAPGDQAQKSRVAAASSNVQPCVPGETGNSLSDIPAGESGQAAPAADGRPERANGSAPAENNPISEANTQNKDKPRPNPNDKSRPRDPNPGGNGHAVPEKVSSRDPGDES